MTIALFTNVLLNCLLNINLVLTVFYRISHLMTSVGDRLRFCSYSGTECHVKTSRQSKPPIWGSPELPRYWNVFQSITSITGQTTALGSSFILQNRETGAWRLVHWLVNWLNRWTEWWKDRWMIFLVEWMHTWINRCLLEWIVGQNDKWIKFSFFLIECMDGWMSRWMDILPV